MKRGLTLTFLLAALSSHAQNATFDQARGAYDNGHYAESVILYDELLESGIANPEVHYNIANACFKNNDLPKAIWHYRVAWRDLPRDPDIKANLHFALNAAGAVDPAPKFVARVLSALSISEWVIIAVAGYATLALLLTLTLLLKTARRFLLKLCLLPLSATLLATAGWWQWRQFSVHPEWIVVKTEATALYGPVTDSTAHYKLPLGAIARQRGVDAKGWVEVEYDGKRGWLKSDYIKRVSP